MTNDEYRVTVPADLGAAIKLYRTRAGMTQEQAAEMAGIGQTYVAALEHGRFATSFAHALRLLRVVGCEVIVRRSTRG
jgi:transcriptional regulator with XRE-family HTH domain